jgi:hypothetical protein
MVTGGKAFTDNKYNEILPLWCDQGLQRKLPVYT